MAIPTFFVNETKKPFPELKVCSFCYFCYLQK